MIYRSARMPMKRSQMIALTLRLDPDLLSHIDDVTEELRMTRSDFIRRSLRRAVLKSLKEEIPLLTSPGIKLALER
jgi:metal-responsive CopG/Arc/MetJ family transcriptional regulator